MCLVASIVGVVLRGQDNNILTQVGFVVLIGLAAKNAILIVEFAKQLEDHGRSRWDAAVEAARLRLRPILMTSIATMLGALPIALALGAGSHSRVSMGIVVIGGLLFSLVLTLYVIPAVYSYLSRNISHAKAESEIAIDNTPVSQLAIDKP